MNKKRPYFLLVFSILLVVSCLAIPFGFVSEDSWNYLYLARSIRTGQGCAIDGQYFAVFPCGYPLLLALTAPSADMVNLLISSKFTNLLLLTASLWLVAKEIRNAVFLTALFVNPVTLHIFEWTWSENLFLFSCCATFFCISRLARGEHPSRHLMGLGLALLLGCSSRYFFAPYCVVIFLATYLAYGRHVALKALPAFMLAGVFFLGYQYFNQRMTGFATGMVRTPAPETWAYLTSNFVWAFAKLTLLVLMAMLVFYGMARKHIERPTHAVISTDAKRAYIFWGLLGLGYLLLAYVLRLRTFFDLFGPRTLGYGVVFLWAAVAAWVLRLKDQQIYPVWALLACGMFSFVFSQAPVFPALTHAWLHGMQQTPVQAMINYRDSNADFDTVFMFTDSVPATYIAKRGDVYPKAGVEVIQTAIGSSEKTRSLADFTQLLHTHTKGRCVLDFSHFSSRADFDAWLEQQQVSSIQLSRQPWRPQMVSTQAFAQDLKDHLKQVFQPGQLVPCTAH